MGDDGSTAQPAGTPKSKLNPFAREFKLNVKAPSFTPASKPSGSALPPGGAGQGPGPVPAGSLPPSQPSGGPRLDPYPTSSHQPCCLCLNSVSSAVCMSVFVHDTLCSTMCLCT